MKRTTSLAFFLVVILGVYSPGAPQAPNKTPQSQALPPEKAQALFQIAPGLKIELVAADPLIHCPVAAVFDEKKRLWVVEMPDYPNGPAPGKPPEGAIKILEDTNGDGQFDKATLFADNLLFANGVLPWKDGAFVTCAPHILFLRDTNNDGKADQREVLYEGFAALNPQLRVSFPILGPDGWVTVANGLRGGQIIRAGKQGEKPLNIAGMDFRFDPRKDQAEPTTGPGQFGNCFDPWGNRFVCDNRHHLRHVVFDNRYLKRNLLAGAGELVQDVDEGQAGPLSSGSKIYPLSRNWTTSNLHAGRFTAACGVFIHQGLLLGENHFNSAFTCDPTGNLVHEEILTPKGATFTAKTAREGVEFLATTDEWFRPVNLTHGPDGALYVVDMCRAVIEHPEFMPVELKNRSDLILGKEKGRIWRIFNPALPKKIEQPSLAHASAAELVNQLGNLEGYWRDTAHRLLLQKEAPASIPLLREALRDQFSALKTFHAAWLLHSMGKINAKEVEALIEHKNPRVQAAALLMAEGLPLDGSLGEKVSRLVDQPDGALRFQAALTASYLPLSLRLNALKQAAKAQPLDRWTRLAIGVSAGDNAGALALDLSRQEMNLEVETLIRELCSQAGSRRDPDEIQTLLQSSLELNPAPPGLAAIMFGLADGFSKRGGSFYAFLEGTKQIPEGVREKTRKYLTQRAGLALDQSLPVKTRLEAIQLLGMASAKDSQTPLKKLLTSGEPEIRLAAVRAIASQSEPGISKILFQDWKTQGPAVRKEILEAMTRTPERIQALFTMVEKEELQAREIDPARVRLLLQHANPAVRERAKKVLASAIPADRAKVLEQFQPSLKMAGDPLRGKQVFQKQCATCHRVGEVGVEIGPDISDTRTKTPAQLLTDILNPNQAIDNNFLNYAVTLKNGRTSTGMISASNAAGITLRRAENQTEAILHQDIEEIQSTGVSLMPEGLEKNISEKDMADLIAYLKNWRYLDGATPLGKN